MFSKKIIVLKCAFLAGAWLVLCSGNPASLLVGLPTIVIAVFISELNRDPVGVSVRPLRLIGFVAYFLKESIRGGIDAASRVFPAKPRLHCGTVTFHSSLPQGTARMLFTNVIGLLPGTLTTLIEDDALIVHALDSTKPIGDDLRDLEQRVAHLFDLSLTDS